MYFRFVTYNQKFNFVKNSCYDLFSYISSSISKNSLVYILRFFFFALRTVLIILS